MKYLREIRRDKGLTVHELARQCKIGSNTMIGIESGIIDAHETIIWEIARVLDISPEDVASSLPNPRRA